MDNTELGKLVLKQIGAFPETFRMSTFGYISPCGTVACLAGHAMLLSGYELNNSDFAITIPRYRRPDGSLVSPPAMGAEAAQLLGMHGQEQAVFYLGEIAVPVFRALCDGAVLDEIPEWQAFTAEHATPGTSFRRLLDDLS